MGRQSGIKDEAALFREMQEGSWDAFNSFFKEYMEQLYLYALAFVKERTVAEDIVQDVFIYLWTNRNRIHYAGSLYAYLLSAVKNACINHKAHLEVEDKYRQAMADAEDYSFAETEWEELRQRVMVAVDSLPPKCREIFILGAVDGMKYQEIADQLGVSVNTVKTQMKFAYRKVKAQTGAEQELLLVILLLGKNIL